MCMQGMWIHVALDQYTIVFTCVYTIDEVLPQVCMQCTCHHEIHNDQHGYMPHILRHHVKSHCFRLATMGCMQLWLRLGVMAYFLLCMFLLWLVRSGSCAANQFVDTGVMPMHVRLENALPAVLHINNGLLFALHTKIVCCTFSRLHDGQRTQ